MAMCVTIQMKAIDHTKYFILTVSNVHYAVQGGSNFYCEIMQLDNERLKHFWNVYCHQSEAR